MVKQTVLQPHIVYIYIYKEQFFGIKYWEDKYFKQMISGKQLSKLGN